MQGIADKILRVGTRKLEIEGITFKILEKNGIK